VVVAGCLALAACGAGQERQAKAAPGEPVLIARWLTQVDARQWRGACALMYWRTDTSPCATGLRRSFGQQSPHFAGVVKVTHGFGRERISIRTGLIAAGTRSGMVGLVNVYAGGVSVDGRPEVVLGTFGPPLPSCTTHSPPCESS
jgi:hypothetical protein